MADAASGRLRAYRTWVAYGELHVPSTSRSRSFSNPSKSRLPPPRITGAVGHILVAGCSRASETLLMDYVATVTDRDDGFTAGELWGLAWALGAFAVLAWVRVAFLLDHYPRPLSSELGLWLGAAVLASVFAAACTVLSGFKSVAGRQFADLESFDE